MILNLFVSICLLTASAQVFDVPLVVGEFFDHAEVDKAGVISGASVELIDAFTAYTQRNWGELLDSVATIAPGEAQQMCLVAVAESLPPKEYLRFLNKLCDMKQQHKIAFAAFERAVLGITPRKQLFLAFNWTDGDVRKVVKRVQRLLPPDHEFQPLLGDILSGAVCEPLSFATKTGVRVSDLLPASPLPILMTIAALACVALILLFKHFWPFPRFMS